MALITDTVSSLTTASGWTDYGSTYAGMDIVRSNDLVSVQFLIKPTSNIALGLNGSYIIATVPVGFRPLSATLSPGWCIVGGVQGACRFTIDTNGSVIFFSPRAATMTTAEWTGSNISFLGA